MAQKAVAKKIESMPKAKSSSRGRRAQERSFGYSVACDINGTYEVTFKGCMTTELLATNRFAPNGISNEQIARALINLTDVTRIDDEGIELVLHLMRKLDKNDIRFQLIYGDGQVSTMIESSGVVSYFARPTWIYS